MQDGQKFIILENTDVLTKNFLSNLSYDKSNETKCTDLFLQKNEALVRYKKWFKQQVKDKKSSYKMNLINLEIFIASLNSGEICSFSDIEALYEIKETYDNLKMQLMKETNVYYVDESDKLSPINDNDYVIDKFFNRIEQYKRNNSTHYFKNSICPNLLVKKENDSFIIISSTAVDKSFWSCENSIMYNKFKETIINQFANKEDICIDGSIREDEVRPSIKPEMKERIVYALKEEYELTEDEVNSFFFQNSDGTYFIDESNLWDCACKQVQKEYGVEGEYYSNTTSQCHSGSSITRFDLEK